MKSEKFHRNAETRHRSALTLNFNILFQVLFMIPVDVLAFIPRLFFGAVLTFVALDLMLDWLVFQYKVNGLYYIL